MELGSVFNIITPNRHELPLLAEESGCMLGKVHQLIWQWPIAGELEVGVSNQLVLTKISCPGGGDPYWFTAHDIPDDDKWGGNTQSMPSMKEHLATLQKPVAKRAPVCVWQVLSFLSAGPFRRLHQWTHDPVAAGAGSTLGSTRWVRAVEEESRALAGACWKRLCIRWYCSSDTLHELVYMWDIVKVKLDNYWPTLLHPTFGNAKHYGSQAHLHKLGIEKIYYCGAAVISIQHPPVYPKVACSNLYSLQ